MALGSNKRGFWEYREYLLVFQFIFGLSAIVMWEQNGNESVKIYSEDQDKVTALRDYVWAA